jgi:sugar O-acyltransferase (sialic acid O-acetyltransferase NeuD family)
MNKPMIILGAGGHAKVVLGVALDLGINVQCLTDTDKSKHGKTVSGIKIEGGDEILKKFNPDKVCLAIGLGVGSESSQLITQLKRRFDIFTKLSKQGHSFPSLVHPNAWVAKECSIGDGVQLFSGSIVQPGCTIGDLTIMNTKASIDHDSIIGKACHLAPGVTCGGAVEVGSYVHIGMSATILPNNKIEDNAIVAAGSVVNTNVSDGEKIGGIPAKVMTP